MDPRVAGAGVAMAVAMLMLLPTFNALNNSYDMSVPPPDWMPMPDEIPEDFQPPEDMEYPEGWEPPPDFEPPPGWEPPPGYEGPIPPGGCPPPVVRPLEEWTDSGSWTFQQNTYVQDLTFDAPKYMVGFGGNITFTNWRASAIRYQIFAPGDVELADEDQAGQGPASLLAPAQPTPETQWTYQSEDPRETGELPPEGRYILRLSAQNPYGGNWETDFAVAIACGGLLQ